MTVRYCHRLHAFKEPVCYELTLNAIVVTEGARRESIPYGTITSIRLAYAPTRIQRNRFRMLIARSGGAELVVTNESYRGVADFEPHDAEYVAFAKALHAAIAAAGGHPALRAGVTLLGYVATVVMIATLAAVLYVTLPLFFAGYGPVGIVGVKLLTIAVLVPVLFRYMRRNRPRRYAPDAIPSAVLPRVQA